MSEFINTLDVLGDDAVIDSIIDRTITEFKDDQVTNVGHYAFYNCTALTEVDLPNVTTVGDHGFRNCSALTKINLPRLATIHDRTFDSCVSIKEIFLPELKTMYNVSYGTGINQFNSCKSLETLILPKLENFGKVTSAEHCTKLRLVDLASAIFIGDGSFRNCPELTSFILRTTQQVAVLNGSNVFINTPIANGAGYIYVPRALVDSYKAATNWSVYAAQFRALEDYTVDGTTTGELDETKI